MTNSVDLSCTEAYLKNAGSKCPSCLSSDIEAGGGTEIEGSSVFVPVTCNNCEAAWDDAYTLSGVANAEGFDPNEPVASKEIALDYGISISVNGGGASVSSQLVEQFLLGGEGENERAEGAADALESFLLSLAAEGVDMESAAMKSALKAAVDSVGNNAF